MDGTLLGVIIGSFLSFLGSFFGHWFTMKKEEQQWLRQQRAEREKRIREAEEANKQSLLSTYHNCTNALSLLVATEFGEKSIKVSDDERLELYKNAHEWLSLVTLHHRDSDNESIEAKFHSNLRYFTETADKFTARSLREQVIELALKNHDLFPDAPLTQHEDPNERIITIQIDAEFRKNQFVEGIELPETFTFRISIEDLTPEQRRKLWDIFFDTYKGVPRRFAGLPMPTYNKERNLIVLRGRSWVARINPLTNEPKNIMRAWELDYENALEAAQGEYKSHPQAP